VEKLLPLLTKKNGLLRRYLPQLKPPEKQSTKEEDKQKIDA